MTEIQDIKFYGIKNKFKEFSNFYPAIIKISGKEWPTTEHYFQAMKFVDSNTRDMIRTLANPSDARKKGRSKKLLLRDDWETSRDDIMRKALKAKFTQHTDLKKLLLSTYPHNLIEHTKSDSYWADGGDGSGKNMLGVLLMELRDKFIQDRLKLKEKRQKQRIEKGNTKQEECKKQIKKEVPKKSKTKKEDIKEDIYKDKYNDKYEYNNKHRYGDKYRYSDQEESELSDSDYESSGQDEPEEQELKKIKRTSRTKMVKNKK